MFCVLCVENRLQAVKANKAKMDQVNINSIITQDVTYMDIKSAPTTGNWGKLYKGKYMGIMFALVHFSFSL